MQVREDCGSRGGLGDCVIEGIGVYGRHARACHIADLVWQQGDRERLLGDGLGKVSFFYISLG
jgi:hypothetical protein